MEFEIRITGMDEDEARDVWGRLTLATAVLEPHQPPRRRTWPNIDGAINPEVQNIIETYARNQDAVDLIDRLLEELDEKKGPLKSRGVHMGRGRPSRIVMTGYGKRKTGFWIHPSSLLIYFKLGDEIDFASFEGAVYDRPNHFLPYSIYLTEQSYETVVAALDAALERASEG